MAYEGGFTSALDSASTRGAQDAYRQQVLQQLVQKAIIFQQQQAQQQKQAQARARLGEMLPQLLGPPPGAQAQPPMPGASSQTAQPQAQPQALPPGQLPAPPAAAAPQGAAPPQAAPPAPKIGPPGDAAASGPPQGWKPLPTPPGAPPQAAGGLPPPPEDAVMPRQAMSVADVAKILDAKGIKGADALDMIEQWKPFMDSQNKAELDAFKVKYEAQAAALKAYQGVVKNAETKRHNVAMEGAANRRADQAQQRINVNVGGGENDLSKDDETRRFMAEQFWAGDKSVMQNLGRGAQGSKNIVALRKEITKVGKETGKSAKDLAAAMAEFEGMKAGERTLGTRTANIEMAGTEADNLADLALKASGQWKRSGIKSLNDLEKYAQGKTASPELRKFVAANTSFINAYARAINPQGVGTVADKEHAREMLEVGFAEDDYAAAIEQLKSEIGVAKKSPRQVKDSMRKGFTGKGDSEYIELRTTKDGRTLGKKADGTIEEVAK